MADEQTGSGQPHSSTDAQHHSAQDVRGGEIILRRPWQRIVFIAGLAGFVILAVVVALAG